MPNTKNRDYSDDLTWEREAADLRAEVERLRGVVEAKVEAIGKLGMEAERLHSALASSRETVAAQSREISRLWVELHPDGDPPLSP